MTMEGVMRKSSILRIAIGLIIIIALLQVVSAKYQIKEKIFKKAMVKKEKALVKKTEIPQEPILVKVYKTQEQDFGDKLPLLGIVKGFKEIGLKFETTGILESFNFKEGERVEEGEIIATLNQKDALLKLKYNEIEVDRTQRLFDIGAIAKPKLDQVNLELESAKRELDKTYLYAPTSGILGTKDAEIGELVNPNDQIANLINDKDVFVDLGIVERDIGKVKVGMNGKMTVDTYLDTEFKGVIDSVSPVVEGKSRTQTAKMKINNPKGLLLPGMFARAYVDVYSAQGVIIIPNAAIDKTEQGYITYVVKKAEAPATIETPEEQVIEEQGVVEARPIETDYRSADYFVVKSGLEEGELVVVETQEKLKDGSKVIVTEAQEAGF